MTTNKKLEVYYHGKLVGTLAEMPDKRVAFQYASEWQKTGFSINPFSLPLRNDVFVPPEKNRDIFSGLFGIFADSLPDAWGNLLMRNFFSSIGLNLNNLSILDKLAYVGTSGAGALEYFPSKDSQFHIEGSDWDYDILAKECNKILSATDSDKIDLLYKLAGSSGGTRPKILIKENQKEWIVKFPAEKDPQISGKREYDYSICAKKCGINMTETLLVPSQICDGYFKTERFDRKNGEKIFTATFSGLLNVDYNAPTCDYITFMKLIQVLTKENNDDKKQMYKQMCFNVLTHNMDDHTKNFSFTFSENTGWRLSPAYDITYSTTYYGEHTTSVNGKGKNITENDLIFVGSSAGLSKEFVHDTLEEIKNQTKMLEKYLYESKQAKRKKVSISDRMKELKH